MTLRLIKPSNTFRKGQTQKIVLYSDDPGTVTLEYSGPVAGPPYVVIPGKLDYHLFNVKQGQGIAISGSAGNAWANYTNYSFFIKVDQKLKFSVTETNSPAAYPGIYLLVNMPNYSYPYNYENWLAFLGYYTSALTFYTRRPSTGGRSIGTYWRSSRYMYYAFKHDGTNLRSTCTRYPTIDVYALPASAPYTGAEGNSLLVFNPVEFYVIPASAVTDQMMIDYVSYGTPPTTYEEYFPCNEDSTKIYGVNGTTSNVWTLDWNTPNYLTPGGVCQGANRLREVVDPVQNENEFTITATGTGTATITAKRRRYGVPDWAPDDEKYETTQISFYIHEPRLFLGPVQRINARLNEHPKAALHIVSESPGTVTINCDRNIINFPQSVSIDESLETTIEGDILREGDCDVTATYDL